MPRPFKTALPGTGGSSLDVRDHLLASAKVVIQRDGLAAASMRAIAKQAGVATGTLYNYFANREKLVVRAIMHQSSRIRDELAAMPDRAGQATVAVNLQHGASMIVDLLQEIVPFAIAIVANPAMRRELRQHLGDGGGHDAARQPVTDYLRREHALGRLHPETDIDAATALILGACHELVFTHQLLGGNQTTLDRVMLHRQIQLLVRGIASESPADDPTRC